MSPTPTNYDPMKPRIYIDKEGNWYQDGLPIIHKRTYLQNNKNLKRDQEGRYYVDEGRGRVYAVVEDTPFVVKMVTRRGGNLYLVLNDETEEILDFSTLTLSVDNVPYTKVKGGQFDARFVRPAYYELTKMLRQEGDKYYIELQGRKHVLKTK
ncbi:MAG: DUF1285 domain-containing protein [Candidatus Dadabacteria bacterium]|nr:DUF1285 domain-containing protein [Candidatus Dadabacteria bacterium]